MMIRASCLILLLVFAIMDISVVHADYLRSSAQNTRILEQTDLLTVTTIECGMIHESPYRGKLTLNYEYQVDTFQDVLLDIPAIEDALVQAVVAYLNMCDYKDRPMYAVQLTDSHAVSSDGK